MRTRLLVSSIALAAVIGATGGLASASDAGVAPASPPTSIPGMDMFEGMGLTPDQINCLVANVGSLDTSDMQATMDLMTQCGITMEQLLEIGQTGTDTLPGEASTTVAASAPAAGELDAAAASAVLALLGLDQAALDCLATEADAAAPADDAAAESVFIACGVGPLQVLEAILALDLIAGGAVGPVGSEPSEPTATVEGAPPVTSGNAMVDLLLSELAAEGINLDAEQGQCLLDNVGSLDTSDMTAMLEVFESCGIDVADLIAGG